MKASGSNTEPCGTPIEFLFINKLDYVGQFPLKQTKVLSHSRPL